MKKARCISIVFMLLLCVAFSSCVNNASSDVIIDGENYTYNAETKTLNIKIQGKMKYSCENAPWRDIKYPEHIVLNKGLTSISNWGFGCMIGDEGDPLNFNCRIKTVEIPNTVKTIGADAFWHCINLKEVNIPDSVNAIGHDAFGECKSIKSVTIPESVKSIGAASFSYCDSLKKVIIKNGVKKVKSYAFLACPKIKKITIPKSVSKIGKYAIGYKDYYPDDKVNNFTIEGYKGTAAEKYAKDNDFKFVALD
ncbi:MAG: leucine-rich repeat domain-containing protein [Ruminococcus sp.]|nr:leucine-rich repeat domain-containing protein [Ruminococcus sp.]